MTSAVKYFSSVTLTQSCTYALTNYTDFVSYMVVSNSYGFKTKNKIKSDFDVR